MPVTAIGLAFTNAQRFGLCRSRRLKVLALHGPGYATRTQATSPEGFASVRFNSASHTRHS